MQAIQLALLQIQSNSTNTSKSQLSQKNSAKNEVSQQKSDIVEFPLPLNQKKSAFYEPLSPFDADVIYEQPLIFIQIMK